MGVLQWFGAWDRELYAEVASLAKDAALVARHVLREDHPLTPAEVVAASERLLGPDEVAVCALHRITDAGEKRPTR